MSGTAATPAQQTGGGRPLSPAVAVLAYTVATVSLLNGALLFLVNASGHRFGAWVTPSALNHGLIGAAMLGVTPGLYAAGRTFVWERARWLIVSTVVVLVGQFTVSILDGGRLYVARGGNIVAVLFSLGWVGVLGVLAVCALFCTGLQFRESGTPLTGSPVPLPAWSKPLLALLGSSWFGIGAGLLLLPGLWGEFIPWEAARPDARSLGVWALALGIGVLGTLTEDDLSRARPSLLAATGVAGASLLVLAARAGSVRWAGGPGISLLVMLTGLLVSGATGWWLLRRAETAGRPAPDGVRH